MNTKVKNAGQLVIGSRIRKFPSTGLPELLFNGSNPARVEVYDITDYNKEYKMISLVLAPESRMPFSSPGDITRMYISPANLIHEDLWWI